MFTLEEFADYVQLPPEEVSEGTLEALKREARVLIRGVDPSLSEDGEGWPENASVVALRVVARGYLRGSGDAPFGATSVSHSAQGFSRSFGFSESSTQPGLWLTKQDRRDLRGSRGGAYMVDVGPSDPPGWLGGSLWTSL